MSPPETLLECGPGTDEQPEVMTQWKSTQQDVGDLGSVFTTLQPNHLTSMNYRFLNSKMQKKNVSLIVLF